jgi:hypothetical protein
VGNVARIGAYFKVKSGNFPVETEKYKPVRIGGTLSLRFDTGTS